MANENQISRNVSNNPLCAKLLEIVEHIEQAEINLKCDVCKNNAVVVLCINCSQCLCKVCHKHHNNEHDIKPLDKASFCPEHKKCIEYYCTKCDEFACSSCKEKHNGEDNHNLGIIEEIASKRRSMLAEVAVPLGSNSETLSQIEAELVTAQKKLEEQLTKLQQSIDNQYEAQFEKLKERHDILKKELLDVVSQQKSVLVAHLEEVKSTQNEVIRVKKLFDDLQTTSDQKVISTKEQIMESQVQKITNQCNKLSSRPIRFGLGEDKLSAYIDGLEIKGNPFSIDVISSQDTPTKIINCDGKMGKTWGISIAKNGTWAVSDISNHCVYIYSSENQLIRKFGEQGSNKIEFNQPFGLAFDSNDYLYVVDGGNHRVQKFDINAKYLLEFGTKGNGNGQLEGPYGITTHLGKVYVADFTNKRISVFQTEGQFCFFFGSDHLAGPRDVAINSNNQLLVADDRKMCTFTLNGDLVKTFGKYGNCQGELNQPLSVATTRNKKILISDKNHCVSIFSEDGQFVRCLGLSHGAAKGQLNYPHGVACKSNSIYVTDLINQRVQIFSLPV